MVSFFLNFLFFCLSSDINTCCCKRKPIPFLSSLTDKKINICVSKDALMIDGKIFKRVYDIENLPDIVDSGGFIFGIDNNTFNSIFNNKKNIIPNFNKYFGDLRKQQYIFAVLEDDNSNCYIIHCKITENNAEFFSSRSDLKRIKIIKSNKITNCKLMFNGCSSLESLDLNGLDTSEVTDMSEMFNECTNLVSVDLSNLNVSKVTTTESMFKYCENLKSVVLGDSNFSSVTNMQNMFAYCTGLEELDLSKLKAPNLTDTFAMFYNCTSLKSINLCNLNAPNLERISFMFSNCCELKSLNLLSFETNCKIKSDSIFSNCSSLKTIKIDMTKNKTLYDQTKLDYIFDKSTNTSVRKY